MLKKLMILFVITLQIVLTTGCGDTSNNGATSLFETASVSFSSTSIDATSTVIAKPNVDDSATKATLTVIVKPYTGVTASSFTVRDFQLIYTQTTGGTAVFSEYGANFSTNLSFSPTLASAVVLDRVVDLGFVPGVTSQSQPWIFNVQATYTVVEDNGGKKSSFSVPLGRIRFI